MERGGLRMKHTTKQELSEAQKWIKSWKIKQGLRLRKIARAKGYSDYKCYYEMELKE